MPAQDLRQPNHRPGVRLVFEGPVEGEERNLGAGLADGRQVGVNDGGIQGVVSQVMADLAQGNPFFKEVGGVAVAPMPLAA